MDDRLFDCAIDWGACIGGATGLGLGIWAMVDLVQPALAATELTPEQASGVTAAIALFGGLEGCFFAGLFIGALAGPRIVNAGSSIASACSSAYHRSSFFCTRYTENNQPTNASGPLFTV